MVCLDVLSGIREFLCISTEIKILIKNSSHYQLTLNNCHTLNLLDMVYL